MGAQTAFQQALALTLREEGGLSNNPHDPGRKTLWGITQHTYATWRVAHNLPLRDVALMTKAECETIYHDNYWTPIDGDCLPRGLAITLFDFAVNSGPHQAIMELQRCMGFAAVMVDGIMGPHTLHEVTVWETSTLIARLSHARLAFDKALETFVYFGEDWTARIDRIMNAALSASVSGAYT